MNMIYTSILLFLFSVWAFARQQKHILPMLITLEACMLSMLLLVFSISMISTCSGFMTIIILVFAACEAAYGLSILTSLLRLRGNDLILSMS
uniref:NADH-ubiquinone oxidoreductase chain 4L n=1 Tax=Onchidella borealis TaxID=244421 RepID=E6Y1C3_9EUPU|nr:NADH dehydrogenase subunit 4L [Onchidella borealis]